jgi:DNA-directed RNA polymerase sigma subunit (sigma70/sigma32)
MSNFDFGNLEDEFREPYRAYKLNQSPSRRTAMVKAVDPIIQTGMRTFGGGANSPQLKGRARLIAANAVDSYDPGRGSLRTHLMASLQGLQRYAAQQNQLIHVPERVAQEGAALAAAENELFDQLSRSPSISELADFTGFSPKRIAYVRSTRPAVTEGQISESGQDDEGFGFEPGVMGPDAFLHRIQFIYDDLDPVDQVLVEHSVGLNGQQKMSGKQLARKLNLSPGAISQRMARIQAQVDELDGLGVV